MKTIKNACLAILGITIATQSVLATPPPDQYKSTIRCQKIDNKPEVTKSKKKDDYFVLNKREKIYFSGNYLCKGSKSESDAEFRLQLGLHSSFAILEEFLSKNPDVKPADFFGDDVWNGIKYDKKVWNGIKYDKKVWNKILNADFIHIGDIELKPNKYGLQPSNGVRTNLEKIADSSRRASK